jgi:hypothetical protein
MCSVREFCFRVIDRLRGLPTESEFELSVYVRNFLPLIMNDHCVFVADRAPSEVAQGDFDRYCWTKSGAKIQCVFQVGSR